jgi:hypothetical protein
VVVPGPYIMPHIYTGTSPSIPRYKYFVTSVELTSTGPVPIVRYLLRCEEKIRTSVYLVGGDDVVFD